MTIRRSLLWFLIGVASVCAAFAVVYAHGGGLDAHGCHHNRKAGGYHCHRGPLPGQSFSSKDEMLRQLNAGARAKGAETKTKGSR